MNKDQIEGNWKQIKGEAKRRWGKLTDDDFTAIAGEKDKLIGKLQERYGYAKERAEKETHDFMGGLKQTRRESEEVDADFEDSMKS